MGAGASSLDLPAETGKLSSDAPTDSRKKTPKKAPAASVAKPTKVKGPPSSKGLSAATLLANAADSEAEAKTLFDILDSNHDGKVSTGEVKTVVKAHGKQTAAEWSDDLIDDCLALFGDSDELLDFDAFSRALSELKTRGGRFDPAEVKSRAAARAACLPVWMKHVKEGGVWDKGCTGSLIRDLNKENYWQDFGAKVTAWHAELTSDETRKAVATLEQFVALYPSLIAETVALRASWAAESDAAAAKAKAAEEAKYAPEKAEWCVQMADMLESVNRAFALGRTPLLVDCTTLAGDDKNGTFSPLETFYVSAPLTLQRNSQPRRADRACGRLMHTRSHTVATC